MSIRKDIDHNMFEFPKPYSLEKRLKDFLEPHVDEKYYLSDDLISKVVDWKAHQKPFEKVLGNGSISPTLTARGAGENHSGMILYSNNLDNTTNLQNECLKIKDKTKKGYTEANDEINVIGNHSPSGHHASRIVNPEGIAPTVTENHGTVTATAVNIPPLRIRKLTPKECYRLMGFSDDDFKKSESVPTSNTQLYKQAGNSIVVDVLEELMCMMLDEEDNLLV